MEEVLEESGKLAPTDHPVLDLKKVTRLKDTAMFLATFIPLTEMKNIGGSWEIIDNLDSTEKLDNIKKQGTDLFPTIFKKEIPICNSLVVLARLLTRLRRSN